MSQEKHLSQDIEYLRRLAVSHYEIEASLDKLTSVSRELGKVNFTESTHTALEHIDAAIRILQPYLQSVEEEIDEKTKKPR